jgi:2-oxoglutarate ferredoxin oxidoreductase subunit alpha
MIKAVNDFVIKFANVNGSGSASANQLFAKSIFRMGVPVAPRNIFPSNIQGSPTWFEVRINDKGYLGRRGGGVDFMVAVNQQTFDADVANICPGGYLLYDSTREIFLERDDLTLIGVPMTALCLAEFGNSKQRQLFKNMVYLGALCSLLDMDFDVLKTAVADQFKGKDKLIAPNLKAIEMGRDYAARHYDCPIDLRVEKTDQVGDRIMIDGNEASALGCVYAGATVAAWYPITPSTSLVDAFGKYCQQLRIDPETKQKRYAIVQAEDELAAIGIAVGASWNGARSFTATSGPGISLMSEFLGLAYFAEVPMVLFDVERGGPSTGMPTRTQQSDLLAAAYASHGDTKHVLLFPCDPTECFDFAAEAFDLSERLQTPILVLSDLDIGMNSWVTDPFKWDAQRKFDRGKVLDAKALEDAETFGRYLDIDGDGIPYRTYPGAHPEKGAFLTRGTSHDSYARYTEAGDAYVENMERLTKKFETAADLVPKPEIQTVKNGGKYGVIYFGSTAPAMSEALDQLAAEDLYLDAMRIRAFPFHESVVEFVNNHERIYIVEQNRDAQLRSLLVAECGINPEKLEAVLHYDGTPITAQFISGKIKTLVGPRKILPLRASGKGDHDPDRPDRKAG